MQQGVYSLDGFVGIWTDDIVHCDMNRPAIQRLHFEFSATQGVC